jgi:hypothetical protein
MAQFPLGKFLAKSVISWALREARAAGLDRDEERRAVWVVRAEWEEAPFEVRWARSGRRRAWLVQ